MLLRFFLLLPVFLFFTLNFSFADVLPLLDSDKLQALDPGRRVSLVKMLDNGGFLCISEGAPSEDKKIILLYPSGAIQRRITLKGERVDYVASSDLGGRVLLYSQDNYTFKIFEVLKNKIIPVISKQPDSGGFALYGGGRSVSYTHLTLPTIYSV